MRVHLRATACMLAISAAGAAGCSTVQPVKTHRVGFFERLMQGEGASRSPAFARARAHDDELASEPEDPNFERVRQHEKKNTHARPATLVPDSRLFGADRLGWPLAHVQVTSPFGQRGNEFHEGVDLKAPLGTSVFAADRGVVIYAGGKIRGYGKMVVIRHSSGIATVYAHNARLLVRAGQRVRKGQRIAVSGKTGHATGPHLHFEVRNGVKPVNPEMVMPNAASATVTADTRSMRHWRHRRHHPRSIAVR